MSLKIVSTDKAPKAIGPYSQAIIANGMLFSAGQIPLNPTNGEMVTGDVQTQAKQVLENIQGVLSAEGLDFSDIVKTTVFITTMDHFPALNEVYASYFGDSKPARSCVAVSQLPKNALVEIEFVAALKA